GGVLADRFDRRRIMVLSDVARVGCMLGLAAVAATGLPIILAPALAALSTAASAPYPASTAATTPRLVPAADLAGANSARSAVGMAAIAAGPVVGAVLLLVLSRSLGFGDAGYGYVLAGMGVGGILGTTLAPRAARNARPRRVLVLALLGVAGPAALMAATPCLTGLLTWAVLGGAGAV